MRLALAIGSIIALVIHGWVFYDQFFHPWQRHQTAYFDQARGLTRNDAERKELEERSPKIEQILVTRFGDGRVDRCTTCHIGADDPRFKDHAQPLKAHSYSATLGDVQRGGKWERRHKFADFGCTVCHEGQGRGLKQHYAHGEDHYWPDPMLGYVTQEPWKAEFKKNLLGKEYMEAACAQCHTETNFPGTPTVERGRRLFFASNCYGCHKIEGLSEGTLGPDLSEAGKKFKIDYLWESIVDPRANSATSFMPKFNLSDADVKSLVVFLKSRRGINFVETSLDRYRAQLHHDRPGREGETKETGPVSGQRLVEDYACTACHKLGDKDGGISPDLSFEGLMKDRQWIADHFKNPRALIPDSNMPTFRFTEASFSAMSDYLSSLKTAPKFASAEETYKGLCLRCHGDKGDGHGKIAIYLDPYPRDLTKAGFINSKTKERLHESVKSGVAGTSMPAWGKVLDDRQIDDVLQYVFTTFTKQKRRDLKPAKVPEQNPVAANAASVQRGEATFVLRCAGCHGKKADGKGPNSLDILPRPRNLTNAAFVDSVADKRLFESILYGVQGTAMPAWVDYGLSNNDVGDLVNFIRSLNPKNSRSQHARSN
ncbi:MAG: c-type cytochrome [Bryobacteraceae bacterium]